MRRERDHRGDIMNAATRSRVMSRIRGQDTGPERTMARLLAGAGLVVEAQARDLPGRPDFVLREHRIAIFVDGAFWHGWRFPAWRHKLSVRWESKIEQNRNRDRRNHRALRRKGWTVIRFWDFHLERTPDLCLERVLQSVRTARLDLAETPESGL
jgi:DNA mismatch endonuclease (patch repair protein)